MDAELDLTREKPQFGNHGNRRHADKVAQDNRPITGVTELRERLTTSSDGTRSRERKSHNCTIMGDRRGCKEPRLLRCFEKSG